MANNKIKISLFIIILFIIIVILISFNKPNTSYNQTIEDYEETWKIELANETTMIYQKNTPKDLSSDTFSYTVYQTKDNDNLSDGPSKLLENKYNELIHSWNITIDKDYLFNFNDNYSYQIYGTKYQQLLVIYDHDESLLYIIESLS